MSETIRTDPRTLVHEARLAEALACLHEEVRQAPADVERRVQLFALDCVLGRYERARSDLDVIQSMDESWTLAAQVYRRLIAAELFRRDVFAGRVRPTILGKPESWMAWNVQALALDADGHLDSARELREQAWQAAPEWPFRVDGTECAWLSDVDRRLGPVLETIIEGNYYWIPFGALTCIAPNPPEFMLDAVWLPARLGLAEGTEIAAYLNARYAGSEASDEGSVCLGRKTAWRETPAGGGLWPVGHKVFESPDAEFPLFECRRIEIVSASTASA